MNNSMQENELVKIGITQTFCAVNNKNYQYRQYLHEKLEKTTSYDEFTCCIANELKERFEVVDWAYAFLALPDTVSIMENVGTLKTDDEHVARYIEQKLYHHDLLLQHVRARDTAIFQSDIIESVKKVDIELPNIYYYKKIYESNIQHGFKEILSIPTTSAIDGGRCMFTVTCRGLKYHKKFKEMIQKKLGYLTSLSMAINDIGYSKYKKEFTRSLQAYKLLSGSAPLNLLKTMGQYDLDTKEGAQKVGIAYNTAKNYIAKIKQSLGVTTIHGALEKARRYELIA